MIEQTKANKKIQISALVMSIIILFTLIAPNVVTFASINRDESQDLDIIEKELEFYFSKVGHLDENKNYVLTNPELLKEKANTGDKEAKKLYSAYIRKNIVI